MYRSLKMVGLRPLSSMRCYDDTVQTATGTTNLQQHALLTWPSVLACAAYTTLHLSMRCLRNPLS
jgi:hypothetical protein